MREVVAPGLSAANFDNLDQGMVGCEMWRRQQSLTNSHSSEHWCDIWQERRGYCRKDVTLRMPGHGINRSATARCISHLSILA